jgi:2'-5' RNA ligase
LDAKKVTETGHHAEVDRESSVLIPVPAAEPVVGEWRLSYDPAAVLGVPAHITLLYPFVPARLIEERHLSSLDLIFSRQEAIEFTLEKVRTFPSGTVYLSPSPPEKFVRLTRLIHRSFPEHPPNEGRFDDVIPHLTIADPSPEPAITERIRASVAVTLPISTTADEIWLMEQGHDETWRPVRIWTLGSDGLSGGD